MGKKNVGSPPGSRTAFRSTKTLKVPNLHYELRSAVAFLGPGDPYGLHVYAL